MKAPGNVSLREIADAVGVSVSTVSRALGDSSRVSSLTKQAVREAMETLAASRTDGGTSPARPMIGVTHSHFTRGALGVGLDIILEQVLAGVEAACLRAGYIPYPWQRSQLLVGEAGEPFFAAVSGVIMCGGLVEPSLLDAIRARGCPAVLIGGHVPGAGVASVAADALGGVAALTDHLVALGHRRIALVNGPADTYTSYEKRAGYLVALTAAGIAPDLALVRATDGDTGFDVVAAEAHTDALLALPAPPTAILYASDGMAAAGARCCQRRGVRVPEDVSVVGFHDDAEARQAHPALTTARVDRVRWGEVATDVLLQQIAGAERGAERVLLPTELTVRDSTAPPRNSAALPQMAAAATAAMALTAN